MQKRDNTSCDQPFIELRTAAKRLQHRLQIVNTSKQIFQADCLNNDLPVTRPQHADRRSPTGHIAPRVARKRGILQGAARRCFSGRVRHERFLEAEHGVGDPDATVRGEWRDAELLAVVQTVPYGIAAGATVVFGL